MSITSGYTKYKRYQKLSDGTYQLVSQWTSSNTVHFDDGATAEAKIATMQTAIDGKAASSHNHAASNITSGTLSSDRLPTVPIAKGGTGATTAASALTNLGLTATATELNYTDGVTSNIQTQLDSLNSSLSSKYGNGSEATFSGVHIGSGKSYIYQENDIIRFRTLDSSGNTQYINLWTMYNKAATAIPLTGSTGITGTLQTTGEVVSTSANAFRSVYGGYGFFVRNDGNDIYFMLTDKDNPYGNWNSFRPIAISASTGRVLINNKPMPSFSLSGTTLTITT